jgi:glutamine amidotransferase
LRNDCKICIIDYGLGNVRAFKNIYDKLNINSVIASKKEHLSDATHLILPGVGAFDWALSRLNESGLREVLDRLVIEKKLPILGVCVGMQIMASKSEEGVLPGLNWIKGKVIKFSNEITLPHMGWNNIKPLIKSNLFKEIINPKFYFLHSYYYRTNDQKHSISVTNYGNNFTSAINKKNIYGTQFHPEKSHENGIKILKNFVNT